MIISTNENFPLYGNCSEVDSMSDSREAEEVARWLDKRGHHKESLPRVYSCGTQTLDLRKQRSRPWTLVPIDS